MPIQMEVLYLFLFFFNQYQDFAGLFHDGITMARVVIVCVCVFPPQVKGVKANKPGAALRSMGNSCLLD